MSRILIVDDNVGAVRATALVLSDWGHQVRVATDGPTGLLAARAWRPEVLLLDIGLPGMDGFAVAAALRQELAFSLCRIIAVSALHRDGDDASLAAAGIDQFLRKPLDLTFLRSLLGKADFKPQRQVPPGPLTA
jgi:CheY-like chemotaxis protein